MNENNDYRPENEGYSNPRTISTIITTAPRRTRAGMRPRRCRKSPPSGTRPGVKITALLLACAVVGGAAGYGGAALSKSGKTTIQQSNRTAQEVTVKRSPARPSCPPLRYMPPQ